MQMVLILQECGMRISELLQLPLDCLTQDAHGHILSAIMQGKMKREHTIPVSQEIARVVQEQQQVVRALKSATLLFPSSKGAVIKQQSFAQRINRLAYDHQIRDANGKLFRFQSHQFRHTVGTRMINLGVPHHFIQRYLGHLGPEMTSRYAHIHDTTMREKLSEYLQGTLVDVTGKAVPEDGPLDTSDLRWFTRNVIAQALPNGYCAIPVVAGPCPASECVSELRSLPHRRQLSRCAQGGAARHRASHHQGQREWMDSADRNERTKAKQPSQHRHISGARANSCLEILKVSRTQRATAQRERNAAGLGRSAANGSL
jgi:hypothetical protein